MEAQAKADEVIKNAALEKEKYEGI